VRNIWATLNEASDDQITANAQSDHEHPLIANTRINVDKELQASSSRGPNDPSPQVMDRIIDGSKSGSHADEVLSAYIAKNWDTYPT